jgi:hypothetical protein
MELLLTGKGKRVGRANVKESSYVEIPTSQSYKSEV